MVTSGTIAPDRPAGRREVVNLALLLFLIFAAITLGRSLRLTFLLQTFGIKSLPYLYILNAVFAVSVSLAFAGVVDRVRRKQALFFTSVILGVLTLAGWMWVGRRFFPVVFFIGVEIATVLLLAQFWNLAAVFFPVREAKRAFPLLTAGGLIGAAAAGFALKLGVGLVHTDNVLFFLGAILVLTGILSGRLTEPDRLTGGMRFTAARGVGESLARPFRDLGEGIAYTSRSRFVQFFFLAFVCSVFITYLIEYEYNRVANLAFPEADKLTAFYGLVQGITFAAAVVVNVLVLGRVFDYFGVGLAYLLYPVGLFGLTGVMAASAGFVGTVGTRMGNDLFLYSVNDGAGNLFLGSVPDQVRGKIRSLIIGVGRPCALGFSGLFLIFGAELLPAQLRLIGIFTFTGVWLFLAVFPLRKHYLSLLGENLTRDDRELKLHALRSIKKVNTPQGYAYILKILAGDDPRVIPLAVNLVLASGSRRLLRRLADQSGSENPRLRAGAVQAAVRLKDERRIPGLGELLADPDAGVRREAAGAWIAYNPPDLAEMFRERIGREADPAVRAVLWEGMIVRGERGEEWKDEARKMLRAGTDEKLAALNLIGKAGIAGFEDEILNTLFQPETSSRAYAALLRGGTAMIPRVVTWLDRDLPQRVKGMLYQFFGDVGGEEALAVLRAHLSRQKGWSNLELIRALARWRVKERRDPLEKFEISLILEGSARRFFTLRERMERYGRLIPPHSFFPLRVYWQKQLEREKGTILELIGLVIDERLAGRIRISLSGGSAKEQRGALEALEEVLPRTIREPVIRIFDQRDDSPRYAGPRDVSEDFRAEVDRLLEEGDRLEQTFALLIMADYSVEALTAEGWDKVRALAADPDPRIREAAQIALSGKKKTGGRTMLTVLEKIVFLQEVGIFQHLSAEDLEFLADIAQEANVGRGEVLFQENEPGDSLFLIVSGSVAVLKEEELGGRRQVATLGEQECVGEMAILSAEPRSATVETREPCTFLVIRGDEFRNLIRMNPQIVYPIFRLLADRLKAATAQAA